MAFKRSDRREALETFLDILQQDKELKREVKVWKLWESKKDYPDPSLEQCPALRVTFEPMASGLADTGSHHCPIKATLELWQKGHDHRDLVDFWGAIERAVYPSDPAAAAAVWDRLNAAGIPVVRITKPAGKPSNREGGISLFDTGEMVLEFYLNT